MTKREFLNTVIATIDNEEVKAFAEKEIAMLDKKNATRSSKPTKTQIENEQIKFNLIEVMTEPMTVSTITKAYNEYFNTSYSVNKFTALVTQMKKNNTLLREVVKGVAYYSVA